MLKNAIVAGVFVITLLAPTVAEAQFTLSGRLTRENSDSSGAFLDDSHVAFLNSGSIDYQSGRWRVGGNFTRGDSSNESFPFSAGSEYSRTWIELYAGYAITPVIEVIGGVRDDSIEVIETFFSSATLLEAEQTLPFAGVRYHSHPRRVGLDASALYFRGTSDVALELSDASGDASGLRLQFALPIRIGQSRSLITPGFDYENFELPGGVEQRGNRFFVQYSYTFGGRR